MQSDGVISSISFEDIEKTLGGPILEIIKKNQDSHEVNHFKSKFRQKWN